MLTFEWDTKKSRDNLAKHGVSFDEAQSVFFDEYARQFFDEDHSSAEDRFVLLGMSQRSRIRVVCHCERDRGKAIRIISARKATAKERLHYPGPMP